MPEQSPGFPEVLLALRARAAVPRPASRCQNRRTAHSTAWPVNHPHAVMLRPARLQEAQAMAEMSRELIEAGLGWRYTPRRVAALIGDPETVALLACDASHLLGFAIMQFGDEQAHLTLLCVQPVQQRRGVGRRLVEWLVASARVAGIASIQVELRADNGAARAFYRRLGFTEMQMLPAYYNGQLAARRMLLQLRPA